MNKPHGGHLVDRLVSEKERLRILTLIDNNGNGNHSEPEEDKYIQHQMYRNCPKGGLPYGNGCSGFKDCFACLCEDCKAKYQFNEKSGDSYFFSMAHSQGRA